MVGRRIIVADTDFHELPRRRLQQLCKRHGIPANKTNAAMADALTDIYRNGNLPPPSPYATPRPRRVRNSEPGMSECDESEYSDSQLGSQMAAPCGSVLSPIPDEPSHSYFCAESAQDNHVVVHDGPQNEALPALDVPDLDVEVQKTTRRLDALQHESAHEQMVTPSGSVLSPVPDEPFQPHRCAESTEDSHIALDDSPHDEGIPAVDVSDVDVEVVNGCAELAKDSHVVEDDSLQNEAIGAVDVSDVDVEGLDVIQEELVHDGGSQTSVLSSVPDEELESDDQATQDSDAVADNFPQNEALPALDVPNLDLELQEVIDISDVLYQEPMHDGTEPCLAEEMDEGPSFEVKRLLGEGSTRSYVNLMTESSPPTLDVLQSGQESMHDGTEPCLAEEMDEGASFEVERLLGGSTRSDVNLMTQSLPPTLDVVRSGQEVQNELGRPDILQEQEMALFCAGETPERQDVERNLPFEVRRTEEEENHITLFAESVSPALDITHMDEEGQKGEDRSDILQEQESVLPDGGESSVVEEMDVDQCAQVKSTHGDGAEQHTSLIMENIDDESQGRLQRKNLYKKTVFGDQSPSLRSLRRALKEKQAQREELVNKRRTTVATAGPDQQSREFGTPLRINGDSISSMTEAGLVGAARNKVAQSPSPVIPSVLVYQDDISAVVEDIEATSDQGLEEVAEPSSVAAVSRESARLVGQKHKSGNQVPKFYGRKQFVEKALESAAQRRLEEKERLLFVAATAHTLEDKENVQASAGGRTAEMLKKHQDGYKTPLTGKSKEKARQVSKKLAQSRRKLILNEKRAMVPDVGPPSPVENGVLGLESTPSLIQ